MTSSPRSPYSKPIPRRKDAGFLIPATAVALALLHQPISVRPSAAVPPLDGEASSSATSCRVGNAAARWYLLLHRVREPQTGRNHHNEPIDDHTGAHGFGGRLRRRRHHGIRHRASVRRPRGDPRRPMRRDIPRTRCDAVRRDHQRLSILHLRGATGRRFGGCASPLRSSRTANGRSTTSLCSTSRLGQMGATAATPTSNTTVRGSRRRRRLHRRPFHARRPVCPQSCQCCHRARADEPHFDVLELGWRLQIRAYRRRYPRYFGLAFSPRLDHVQRRFGRECNDGLRQSQSTDSGVDRLRPDVERHRGGPRPTPRKRRPYAKYGGYAPRLHGRTGRSGLPTVLRESGGFRGPGRPRRARPSSAWSRRRATSSRSPGPRRRAHRVRVPCTRPTAECRLRRRRRPGRIDSVGLDVESGQRLS